jgi:hypothetical protein
MSYIADGSVESDSHGAMRISTQLIFLPKKNGPSSSMSISNASRASVNSLEIETISGTASQQRSDTVFDSLSVLYLLIRFLGLEVAIKCRSDRFGMFLSSQEYSCPFVGLHRQQRVLAGREREGR